MPSVTPVLSILPIRPLRRHLSVATLVGLTLAAYSNSFFVGFPLDNKQLILQDPRVHEASAANIGLVLRHTYWWPYGESGLYRPLTTLSYLFNYAVLGNGASPLGYHLVNISLHIANVLLLHALILRIADPGLRIADIGSRIADAEVQIPALGVPNSRVRIETIAFAAAALWAVLPVSVEAVTNIVGRADLLATLAVFVALLMYLNFRDASGNARIKWLAGVAAATLVGVFAKESAIAIPAVIALYEIVWWSGRRSIVALSWSAAAFVPPLLLMWAARAASVAGSPAARFPFTDNPIAGAGFVAGRLTAVNVMARYLGLLVWPATLSADYSYPQIPLARGSAGDVVGWLAVLAVAAAAIAAFKRQRTTFFFAAFAFITFLPASNLLFPTGTIMAERLLYLPSAGIVPAFALALFAERRVFNTRAAAPIIAVLLVSAFAARTWTRNPDWKDDVTLWRSAVWSVPRSAKAHRALAEALYDADPTHANIDQVIAEAEASVALLSDVPDEMNAFQSFRQAAAYYLDKRDPRLYPRALHLLRRSLSIVRATTAKVPEAGVAPEADLQRLIAAAQLGLGNGGEALDAATRARTLAPLHPLAYRLAADALLSLHRPDDAAIALTVGSLVTGDTGLGRDLMGLYRNGLDAQGCAVVGDGAGAALNPSCPIVHAHVCAATAEAVAVNDALGHRDQSERLKRAAISGLGCSAEPLETRLPNRR